MQVDVIGSQPHYLAHCRPILAALPDSLRGIEHPLAPLPADFHPRPNTVVLAAGAIDAFHLQAAAPDTPVIFVEHGAGQTYTGDPEDTAAVRNPSYSSAGGERMTNVIGFICPSQRVADRWTSAPAVAVGCPKMDRFINDPWQPTKSVCLTFHWDCRISLEARWAWPHYSGHLMDIRQAWERQGFRVFGHAHPRVAEVLQPFMRRAGLTWLERDEDVFSEASILVADNTSLGPEFASLGRSVVWMNAPWYRRNIHHGGRFWDWTKGPLSVDDPPALKALDLAAIEKYPAFSWGMAGRAYAHVDGKASERAAMWIGDLLAGLGSRP